MRTTNTRLWQRGLLLMGISGLVLLGCKPAAQSDADTAQTTPASEAATPADSMPAASTTASTDASTEVTTDTPSTAQETNTPPPADAAPVDAANTANADAPAETLAGAQITDMRYQNAAGETISVVYTTSPSGILSARLSLPNQAPMTLNAPEGQGNNPTYRSSDGKTQLVSHGGGNSIDVIVNDTVTSFEATSADARVVTTS